MSPSDQVRRSLWPHRWAVALACATFPLVWVGGLVTTTDAGMAVPDWPYTYGYNLFLYPWQSWLAGPWDLFVEHGHRMLAATVGLITIGSLIVFMRLEPRRWARRLSIVALALVLFQGALGGMRVLLDERTLAMAHGITGPLFFGFTVVLAVITSQRWQAGTNGSQHAVASAGGQIRAVATVTAVLAYLQIVLGAVLRHVPVDAQPGAFLLAVKFHLFLAAVLTLHIVLLVALVLSHARLVRPLGGLSAMLISLLILQLGLGAGTWFVKYSVPEWANGWVSNAGTVIRDGGWLQTHVITAHVATGSAIFGTAIALAMYSHRVLRGASAVPSKNSSKLGVAV